MIGRMVRTILTRETLLPAGVAAAIMLAAVSLTWTLAVDRERAFSRIDAHEVRISENRDAIKELQGVLGNVRDALIRIEEKLDACKGSGTDK